MPLGARSATKNESGEERSDREPCSIYEIVSSSLNIYQFTANKKTIKLVLQDEGEIPALLLMDKMQVRRLIDNVLSNAVKYSPTETAVNVLMEREGELLKIHVQDEGPGIPEDEMHKLFTDFGKTSVQPTGNETSTGLGLSICKKIVEAHQGTIYAANRSEGTGAVFTIEFNVEKLAMQV